MYSLGRAWAFVVNMPVSSTVYPIPSAIPEIVYVVPGTALIVQTLPYFVPLVTVASIISLSNFTSIIKEETSEGIASPFEFITFLTLKLPVAFEDLYTFLNEAGVAVETVPATTVTTASALLDAVVSSV